jgi:hypothetical protein
VTRSEPQALEDDVLDADEVRVLGVAVEEQALQDVLVDLPAEVVILHLHGGLILGALQSDDVDVEGLQGLGVLQEVCPELEAPAPMSSRRATPAARVGAGRRRAHLVATFTELGVAVRRAGDARRFAGCVS